MNIFEIENAIKYIQKKSPCMQCKEPYKAEDIEIIATTKTEILFDIKCSKCSTASIITMALTPEIEIKEQTDRMHRKISKNDVLDVKNFLSNFDGNFKKIFTKKQQ